LRGLPFGVREYEVAMFLVGIMTQLILKLSFIVPQCQQSRY
jgi:hypothetical protein